MHEFSDPKMSAERHQSGRMDESHAQARAQGGRVWLENFFQDLRYAFRQLEKAPGFAAVAVVTLALGIGVNTAIFSVIYGVLLDPYPYAKSGEIWAPSLVDAKSGRGMGFSVGDYLEMAKLPGVASAMATGFGSVALRGDQAPEIISAPRVSGSAFEFLGVPPILGRGFTPADIKPNGEAEPVTVLSFKFWQARFNGDRAVIGRTITLDDVPHVVIGVMPPRFGWYGNDGLWLPLPTTDPKAGVRPIVRFKSGTTKEVAGQQLLALARRLAEETPQRLPKDGLRAAFSNYLDVTVSSGEMRSSLHLLFYAVGFLLLIACTNVANLLLARGATRRREVAVRLALGAGRHRLIRQLLTESVGLALVGGLCGVLFAFGLTRLIVALMPDFYVPNEARVTMNGWVLAFSVGLSMLTGILFGLAPALQSTRPDVNEALKDGGHGAGTGGIRSARTRDTLVVVEVALSIVLLVGATLAIRGFVELQGIDRGFRTEKTLLLRLPLSPKRYTTLEQRNGFTRALLDRVQALPGVASAAIGTLPGFEAGSGVTIPGQPKPADGVALNYIGADYLDTLGMALRMGRNLTVQDIAHDDHVALISEAAAKLWVDGASPIGRTIAVDSLVGGGGMNLPLPNAIKEVTVVGIVADTRTRDLRGPPPLVVFVPYTLRGPANRTLIVRTQVEPTALVNSIRTELRALDPEQPMLLPQSVDEIMDRQVVQPRFNMVLFGGLAGVALALAAAGIYSVLSYNVAQRTREIGVRMALGAGRADILKLVVGAGSRLIAVGLIAGIGASLALAKIVTSEVFIVPLVDPLALTAAALVLSTAALAACYLPARRASKVDPMVALRCE